VRKLLEVPVLLVAFCVSAGAAQVTVSDAWFRALPGALPAAGYFTIRNTGSAEIAVTGAQARGCGNLMLHQSTDMGGMSGMAMVEKVLVPAGGSVKFAPGSYHLMCEGAKLKVGTKMPVALRFSDGTSQVVSFAVRNATGK
jgi:periplasmic copper chaperone A